MSLAAVSAAHGELITAEEERDRAKLALEQARSRVKQAQQSRVTTMLAYVDERGHAALREMSEVTGLSLARIYALVFQYNK